MSLSINGKTFYPEPLVFYAGTLRDAGNPAGAAVFLDWLNSEEAQGLFRSAHFDPAERRRCCTHK